MSPLHESRFAFAPKGLGLEAPSRQSKVSESSMSLPFQRFFLILLPAKPRHSPASLKFQTDPLPDRILCSKLRVLSQIFIAFSIMATEVIPQARASALSLRWI